MEIPVQGNWLQILSAGINLGTLIIGFKVIHYLSRMEMKVEMMWAVFARKYGDRTEDKDA